jgi:hypothetical protein
MVFYNISNGLSIEKVNVLTEFTIASIKHFVTGFEWAKNKDILFANSSETTYWAVGFACFILFTDRL